MGGVEFGAAFHEFFEGLEVGLVLAQGGLFEEDLGDVFEEADDVQLDGGGQFCSVWGWLEGED